MNGIVYIFVCLIWGTTWVAIKIGLEDIPPVLAAALRMLMAAGVLFVFNLIAKNKYPALWKDKLRVAWPGVLLYGAGYALGYYGMLYISSGMASILFATLPFFIVIFVPFMVKFERVTIKSLLGVVVGFLGIIIVFNGTISFSEKAVIGSSIFLLATAVTGYINVHIKAYLSDVPLWPMLTLQLTAGGASMLVVSYLVEVWPTYAFNATSIGSILYLAVFGSVIGCGGYYWLLRRISTIEVSLVAFITPIVAIVSGYLILDEVLGTHDLVGSMLVLSGVFIVSTKTTIETRCGENS